MAISNYIELQDQVKKNNEFYKKYIKKNKKKEKEVKENVIL